MLPVLLIPALYTFITILICLTLPFLIDSLQSLKLCSQGIEKIVTNKALILTRGPRVYFASYSACRPLTFRCANVIEIKKVYAS